MITQSTGNQFTHAGHAQPGRRGSGTPPGQRVQGGVIQEPSLTAKGYVERRPHPGDARARLVMLTEKGWAWTRAADAAMAGAVRPWEKALGGQRLLALRDDLTRIAPPGPLRPTW